MATKGTTTEAAQPPKPDLSAFPEIPAGALVTYNSAFGLFQVFRVVKLPHPKTGVLRWTREQIGSIKNNEFTLSPTYKLKQRAKDLEAQVESLQAQIQKMHANAADGISSEETKAQVQAPPEPAPEAVGSAAEELRGAEKPRQVAQKIAEIIKKTGMDKRKAQRVEIPMITILLAALMTALGGTSDCEQISDSLNHALKAFFSQHLPDLAVDKVSADTVRQVLMLIEPDYFDDFYMEMIAPLIRYDRQRIIAADGQSVRATGQRDKDRPELRNALMLMNFYDVTNRVCLYHRSTGKKENEISVGPECIRKLNIEGAVVTADAMSCQVNFVNSILKAGGHYCLAVKSNQEVTMSELRYQFNHVPEDRQQILNPEAEMDHGRIDTYKVAMLPGRMLSAPIKDKWSGLEEGCIVHVQRKRSSTDKKTGKVTGDERFYISSLSPGDTDVKRMAEIVRTHRGMENRLHWMLDMWFSQDRMQAKNPYYISNRSALNKLALSLLEHYRAWLIDTGREKQGLSIQKLVGRCAKSPEIAMQCIACGLGLSS